MSERHKTIISDLIFPECMRWREGQLWFVDMYDGKLFRVNPSSSNRELLLSRPGRLGGIGWLSGGDLLVAEKDRRVILRVTGQDEAEVFADLSKLGTSPINEVLVLPDDSVLVTEYGFRADKGEPFTKGSIFRIAPDGGVSTLPGKYAFPNGMVFLEQENAIAVAETMARRITKVLLGPTEEAAAPQPIVQFEHGFPDGMSAGTNDSIWCALVQANSAQCITLDGKTVDTIATQKQAYDVLYDPEVEALFVAVSEAKEKDLASGQLPRSGEILRYDLSE